MPALSLQTFNEIPRVGRLLVSPDGGRLVLEVQVLSADNSKFVTSLWELPSDGSAPARRLTWSAEGEGGATFLSDGSLAFTSGRKDPTVKEDEAEGKVWLLPAGGGDARPLLAVPGGIRGLAAARDAQVLVVRAQLFEGATGIADDAARGKRRKDANVKALLFEAPPIRFWDHDLGPRQSRLLKLRLDGDGAPEPEDLGPNAGSALHEAEVTLSPDGSEVVTTWQRHAGRGFFENDLVRLRSGEPVPLAGGGADFHEPAFSPDGRLLVAVRADRGDPDRAPDLTLWLVDLQSGEGRDLVPDLDLWPSEVSWAPDSRAVYFAADERGHRPLFKVDVESGRVDKLTESGSFTSPRADPRGGAVFALRSSYGTPPEVVRVEDGGAVTALPTPGLPLEVPGCVSEVGGRAPDGTEIRAWLVTPKDASVEKPAPLVLWIHGGPLGSWNSWHWRWCPHILVERGYAVLLPDPALSTGYGRAFIQRGWGRWGDVVLDDLDAVLEETLKRPDIDGSRLAAMGGSFGGYMANWIAGRSDRYRAIVTHASLWAFDQFHGTTDMPSAWERQFGDPEAAHERYEAVSPHRNVGSITTPMLLIHGLQDYRVPVSEALRLWTDLVRHDVPARFLYFPDENHWVLRPANATLWYETVLAFLDENVLGEEWKRPELL